MISKPWDIIIHRGPPATFWLPHPMGGYFQLPRDEMEHARLNGSGVIGKPSLLDLEKIDMQLQTGANNG